MLTLDLFLDNVQYHWKTSMCKLRYIVVLEMFVSFQFVCQLNARCDANTFP